MSKSDKRNQRRGGFYWNQDDLPYVSVTTVLKIIDKPGLRYWFGREVYNAMCQDPTMSEKAALSAPYRTTESAAKRGSIVHDAIESYGFGKKALEYVDDIYQPYVDAFRDWVKDVEPKFIANEKTVFNDEHRYAGTLDAIIEIGGKRKVVDFKTNKDSKIYDEAHLQASAYIETQPDIDEGLIVCFGKNGSYNQQAVDKNFEVFLAAKKIWEYKNQHKLQRINYYQ